MFSANERRNLINDMKRELDFALGIELNWVFIILILLGLIWIGAFAGRLADFVSAKLPSQRQENASLANNRKLGDEPRTYFRSMHDQAAMIVRSPVISSSPEEPKIEEATLLQHASD